MYITKNEVQYLKYMLEYMATEIDKELENGNKLNIEEKHVMYLALYKMTTRFENARKKHNKKTSAYIKEKRRFNKEYGRSKKEIEKMRKNSFKKEG